MNKENCALKLVDEIISNFFLNISLCVIVAVMCHCYICNLYNILNIISPITGLDRFQEVEVPRFQYNRHIKVVRFVSPTHWPPFPSRKYSRYSFLLEAEATPGL